MCNCAELRDTLCILVIPCSVKTDDSAVLIDINNAVRQNIKTGVNNDNIKFLQFKKV